jgi:hypothetical protein
MKWPSTEVVVFGVLGAMLLAGRIAEVVFARLRKKEVPASGNRLMLLMTLVGLVLLVAVAAYFWFLDPASDALREWLGVRGASQE